jgi:predicted nucleic acid-binding protein
MASGKHILFIDTSGWIEVFGRDLPFHNKARDILTQAVERGRQIVTTNYVIVEFIGHGGKKCKLSREGLFKAVDEITKLRGIKIVYISEGIHKEEIMHLRGMPDKTWSLVDATSFHVMRELGIIEALAKDGDFTQAGFKELIS